MRDKKPRLPALSGPKGPISLSGVNSHEKGGERGRVRLVRRRVALGEVTDFFFSGAHVGEIQPSRLRASYPPKPPWSVIRTGERSSFAGGYSSVGKTELKVDEETDLLGLVVLVVCGQLHTFSPGWGIEGIDQSQMRVEVVLAMLYIDNQEV